MSVELDLQQQMSLELTLHLTDQRGVMLVPSLSSTNKVAFTAKDANVVLSVSSKFGTIPVPLPLKTLVDWMQQQCQMVVQKQQAAVPVVKENGSAAGAAAAAAAKENETGWTNIKGKPKKSSSVASVSSTSLKAPSSSSAPSFASVNDGKRSRKLFVCDDNLDCCDKNCVFVHGVFHERQDERFQRAKREAEESDSKKAKHDASLLGIVACAFGLVGSCAHFKDAVCSYRHFTSIWSLTADQKADLKAALQNVPDASKKHHKRPVETQRPAAVAVANQPKKATVAVEPKKSSRAVPVQVQATALVAATTVPIHQPVQPIIAAKTTLVGTIQQQQQDVISKILQLFVARLHEQLKHKVTSENQVEAISESDVMKAISYDVSLHGTIGQFIEQHAGAALLHDAVHKTVCLSDVAKAAVLG